MSGAGCHAPPSPASYLSRILSPYFRQDAPIRSTIMGDSALASFHRPTHTNTAPITADFAALPADYALAAFIIIWLFLDGMAMMTPTGRWLHFCAKMLLRTIFSAPCLLPPRRLIIRAYATRALDALFRAAKLKFTLRAAEAPCLAFIFHMMSGFISIRHFSK